MMTVTKLACCVLMMVWSATMTAAAAAASILVHREPLRTGIPTILVDLENMGYLAKWVRRRLERTPADNSVQFCVYAHSGAPLSNEANVVVESSTPDAADTLIIIDAARLTQSSPPTRCLLLTSDHFGQIVAGLLPVDVVSVKDPLPSFWCDLLGVDSLDMKTVELMDKKSLPTNASPIAALYELRQSGLLTRLDFAYLDCGDEFECTTTAEVQLPPPPASMTVSSLVRVHGESENSKAEAKELASEKAWRAVSSRLEGIVETAAQGYVQQLNNACLSRHELGMPLYSFSSSAPSASAQAAGPFLCKCEVAVNAFATNAPRPIELRQQGRAVSKKGAQRVAAKLVLDQYANVTI